MLVIMTKRALRRIIEQQGHEIAQLRDRLRTYTPPAHLRPAFTPQLAQDSFQPWRPHTEQGDMPSETCEQKRARSYGIDCTDPKTVPDPTTWNAMC